MLAADASGRYDRQEIPDDNVLTHHSTYLMNRFIDDAYKARMERRKQVDPKGYLIYGLGEWGEIGGLILHTWEIKEISQDHFGLAGIS